MRRYRILADLLTELRLVLGPLILLATQIFQELSLPFIAAGQMMSWTSDLLDGALARRAPAHSESWVSRSDLAIDVIEAACLLIALAIGGWVDPLQALWYGLVAALLLTLTRFARSVAMVLQAPVYLWLIVIALQSKTAIWGWLMIGWIGLVVALTWPRFPHEIVPGFIAGMSNLRTHSRHTWQTFNQRIDRWSHHH